MTNNIDVNISQEPRTVDVNISTEPIIVEASIFQNVLSASLAGLDDVSLTSLVNNQILQYNSTTARWENVTLDIPDTASWGNITGTLSDQTDLQSKSS